MSPTGLYELEDGPEGRTVVVTGRWSGEAAEVLRSGSADGLTLNYARGFSGSGLEFLEMDLPVHRLDLLDRSIEDLEPIVRLAGPLQELSVQAAPGATLDLAPLRLLCSVASEWQLMRDTLRDCDHLQSVTTWRFDELDLHSFRDHVNLRRVTIKEAPYLETLWGIDALPDLQQLKIQWARRLRDTSDLADLSESIRDLDLEKCAAIDAVDDVEPLRGLTFLGLNDCKDIASLAPVGSLHELRQFYAWGSTRIVDGDLSPLQGLPRLSEIRMRDRGFYSPSLAEIRPTAGA